VSRKHQNPPRYTSFVIFEENFLLIHSVKPARIALVLLLGTLPQLWAQTPATPPANKPANAGSPTLNQSPPSPVPARRGGAGAGGDYKEYDPETLERGKKTYSANCAFCHGGNAKGGESGPDLLRSITVLHDENGDLIGKVVLNGRPDKGMPKFSFSPEQIAEIAAFLHDGVRAAAQRGTYKILDILVGDPKAGEAYFNGAGKCTTCHSVTGDLAHIGSRYDTVNLQQKIVMPREGRSFGRRAPEKGTAVTATITLPSGEVVEGALNKLDDFAVSVIDKNGEYRSFTRDGDVPAVQLHDPMEGHTESLKQYSDADIHNLTAYLVTLK
jgi:cytochrome c oxidase cbb3-type subunit 3